MRFNSYLQFILILSFCASAPQIWAQQKPAENSSKTIHYSYRIIAKRLAKQYTILDGLKISSFDGSHFLGTSFLADSGDFIFWAYTDKGRTLFKNQHALAYNGKIISGFTVDTTNDDDPDILSVNAAGDVLYSFKYKVDNGFRHAIALNDAVVCAPQDQGEITAVAGFSSPGFTKDGAYAIPVLVKNSSEIKWLIGGAIQDAAPADAVASNAPITGLTHSHVFPNGPVGINTRVLFQDQFGTKDFYDYDDIIDDIFHAIQCNLSRNSAGQIAMVLNARAFELSAHSMFEVAQVVLIATPIRASPPNVVPFSTVLSPGFKEALRLTK